MVVGCPNKKQTYHKHLRILYSLIQQHHQITNTPNTTVHYFPLSHHTTMQTQTRILMRTCHSLTLHTRKTKWINSYIFILILSYILYILFCQLACVFYICVPHISQLIAEGENARCLNKRSIIKVIFFVHNESQNTKT